MTVVRRPIATAVREALLLLAMAVVVAVALWFARSDRLPLNADAEFYALDLPAPLVSVDEARAAYDTDSQSFVDTRTIADPEQGGAIPGSFVIRAATFDADLEAVMDFIYPEDPLILFGQDSPVPVGDVAARFLDRGYENVRILQGGLRAWTAQGGPTDAEVIHE